MGNKLQNLGTPNKLDLLTFCSAPYENGWAFVFAWHETSSFVCVIFLRSLATVMHENKDSLGDYLFRLVMGCENIAIAPLWWVSLTEDVKETIADRFEMMVDGFTATDQGYLTKGLEGISNWKFEKVISEMGGE